MKLLISITAALAVAAAASTAPAQDRTVQTTVTQHSVHSEQHDEGPRWRTKRVCKVRWTHHHRVKRCWTTRVRY